MIRVFIIAMMLIPFFAKSQCILNADTTRIHAEELIWMPAKPPFPPGAFITTLEGSSISDGMFTIRVKFPSHYFIDAHFHPEDERVTVIDGSVYIGFGESVDTINCQKFVKGDFYVNPKHTNHFVFTKDEPAELQLNCKGPWGMSFCKKQ